MMLRLLLSLFLVFGVLRVHGQAFTIFNYNVPEGLPSPEVYEVFEDRQGFLWFATDQGVVKFDGQEMKTFQLKDGLTDPVVFGFQEDASGRIWFRTFSGRLCFYENGRIIAYPYNDKLTAVATNGLVQFNYIADDGELWFTVRNRFGLIDREGNITVDTLRHPTERDAIIYRTVKGRGLVISANQSMYIKWVFINNTPFRVTLSPTEYGNRVFDAVYWRKKLYLSMYNDVLVYDGESIRKVGPNKHPVISLSVDREDNLWVGYLGGGVKRFSSEDFSSAWEPDFLDAKSVTNVLQDRRGAFWFSTLENGVYHIPNLAIQYFPIPGNSKIKSVTTSDRYIAVSDKQGAVRFYDAATMEIRHQKKFDYNVMSIFSDSRKNFWISGHSAIASYDSDFNLLQVFSDVNAGDFFQSPDGTVWGMGSQRLLRFDNAHEMNLVHAFPELYRQLLIQDSTVFLAGRIGLHIHSKDFLRSRSAPGFEKFKINDIGKINDSTLLFSTIGNGFLILNTTTWKIDHYHAGNRFIANNIYATALKDSVLWIGTEEGLAFTDIRSLLSGIPRFSFLSKNSGLGSNTVNFLATAEGSVWAFSDDGFSVVPDTLTRFATNNPEFYIKSIEANGDTLSTTDLTQLSAEQSNLKFRFGFISFNNDNVFVRYRISPSQPWIHTRDRVIELTAVAPDDYSFQLQYTTDFIRWQNAMDPIAFSVAPPWYRKWYVYPAAIVALALLSYLYFRYQRSIYREKHHFLRIINEHQQKLIQSEVVTVERERTRIAKELHDGIGTTLTAIKLQVSQLLRNHQEPMADDIEDQFQSTIAEIKNIIYGLTPPSLERYGLFTGLRNYVNKLGRNLPLNLSLKTYGYDVGNHELNIIVFRVIQELISNSVKHSRAKNISIHLSCFDDLMSLIYEDDGIGFRYGAVQNGLGLDSIESRIQSVNGTLEFNSGHYGISYNIEIPLSVKKEVS